IAVDEPSFEEWLRTERERLRELVGESLARLLKHQMKEGSVDQAVQTAVRLLGLDPAEESVHQTLMPLYAQQGRRGAGLRQYQVCVDVLQRELGAEPTAATKQLYRELLQVRPKVAPPADQLRRSVELTASPTAMVGRTVELGMLRERLKEAWQGRGGVGVIQGEAGGGRKRLVEWLVTGG